jgi:acetyl esterase
MATPQPLDPGMQHFNEVLSSGTPPEAAQWPLHMQRDNWNTICRKFRASLPDTIVVEEAVANGIPVRIYRPRHRTASPGVIYAHGGGWVLGGFDTHEDMCAELAFGADCAVVLHDYRLAPEHPHPAQLEDQLKVWRWMLAEGAQHGIDTARLIAAGDSCGGQMSVALALTLRELNLRMPDGMVLIYPVLGADFSTPSYVRNATQPNLSLDEMKYYLESFLGPHEGSNWRDAKALPALEPDLTGLPPTAVTVAWHDPLYDDGTVFARRLQEAGVACDLREEPALAHSYMRARHHSAPAMAGFQWIVEAMRKMSRS